MSYTTEDLNREIDTVILGRTENGQLIDPDWIATQVINAHVEKFEKFSDFETCCIWAHVRRLSGVQIRKFDRKAGTAEYQEPLPGFDSLQPYYERTRAQKVPQPDGTKKVVESVLRIPRDKLTTVERREIAAEFRAVAEGYNSHADQLDRETDDLIERGVLDDDE